MSGLETLGQWAVFVLGGAAIWLVSEDGSSRRQRWGWLIGLLSQPLWLWLTWESGQWGLFCLSLWYTLAWGKGVKRWWLL